MLTGPEGIVFNEAGLKALLDNSVRVLPPGSQGDLSRSVLEALVELEDLNRSLPFAMLKGQPAKLMTGNNPLMAFLKGFIDASGVPGGKNAQYLAFTKAFEEFNEAFVDFQDGSFPLAYLTTLETVQKSTTSEWRKKNRVLGVAGFGTVNIAVFYCPNDNPSDIRVLRMLRQDVQSKMESDFSRMTRLVELMRKKYPNLKDFDTVAGLMPLIRRSIQKEFDLHHVMEMSRLAAAIYNVERRGVLIHAIQIDGQVINKYGEGGALDMAKARGISAKKLRQSDPQAYAKYMAAFLELERDVLLGKVRHSDGRGFVNPDIHDGQLFIDQNGNTVDLIDVGQGSVITDEERAQAIGLLRVVSGLFSIDKSAEILRQFFGVEFNKDSLKTIMSSSSRMDRFVKIIAYIGLHGGEVPTATADWMMAFDRWLSLGKSIGWNELMLVTPFINEQGGSAILTANKWLNNFVSAVVPDYKNAPAVVSNKCEKAVTGPPKP